MRQIKINSTTGSEIMSQHSEFKDYARINYTVMMTAIIANIINTS